MPDAFLQALFPDALSLRIHSFCHYFNRFPQHPLLSSRRDDTMGAAFDIFAL